MAILNNLKTIGRVLKYWFHVRRNESLGFSDFSIIENVLSNAQLDYLDGLCSPEKGTKVKSEIIDERYIFPLDGHFWSEISAIKLVSNTLENFSPTPRPGYFMRNLIVGVSSKIGSGGGWHRDSFMPQIKIFIPLTDIDEDDGALQYVLSTSSNREKLFSSFQGRRKKSNYRPINYELLSMKRGDIAIVNTSGIHRGGPPAKTGRDMVTIYMNETFTNNDDD